MAFVVEPPAVFGSGVVAQCGRCRAIAVAKILLITAACEVPAPSVLAPGGSTGRLSPADESAQVVVGIAGKGTTVPPEGASQFPIGTIVRFEAVPAGGFRFVRWSGDVQTTSPGPLVVIDRDLFLTAEFATEASLAPRKFFLPWAPGESHTVSQGNFGAATHGDRYAWDFPMPVGTPVLAVGVGRVIGVRENSLDDGMIATEAGAAANVVTIDHGGGYVGLYAHLDSDGVLVSPGQFVTQGQVIGYSGNTGFSTSPHLHFEMLDASGVSIPSAYFEAQRSGGVPRRGDSLTSKCALRVDTVNAFRPSILPIDAFIENRIELLDPAAPAFTYRHDTDYVIRGRVLDDKQRVCVALVDPQSLETVYCEFADVHVDDGSFEVTFRIPASFEGRFHFGVISGDEVAEGLAPREIIVVPPVSVDDRPVASIEPAVPETVDYFESTPLSAGGYSGEVAELNYQWAQVSGPPAAIRDPTAPETVFTIEPGAGSARVAFQLTLFDGARYGLPAEVTFTMPDTFIVSDAGLTNAICRTRDECASLAPEHVGVVSRDVAQWTGWIELANAQAGDVFEVALVDPRGAVRRIDEFELPVQPAAISFWRFEWPTAELAVATGQWSALVTRNGIVESTYEFSVVESITVDAMAR